MQLPTRAFDKKETALAFLKLAASGKVSEAFDKYISRSFRHHNPHFRGDAKALKAGMMEAHQKYPNTTIEVQHLFEEGNLVAVHSRVIHSADAQEIAVVHTFHLHDRLTSEMATVRISRAPEPP